MKNRLVVAAMAMAVLVSFSCKKDAHMSKKYDPALRHLLESASIESSSGTSIPIIGTCSSEITDSLRAVLEKAGARVGTISGRFFTADIPRSKLEKIASLSEVRYLQLAPKAKPTK
ncbi:MAG: hypothetical protein GXO76_03325 [Calditrichaeota bacterium]|nr:hypothetical protein [Calditrichota bacterium]